MSSPAIRLEGGLFGPDILEQLLSGDLPGQKAQDFGLDARRSLTDEMAAIFAEARAQWSIFQQRLQRLAPADVATTTTRDAWVIPFLSSLGYELTFNARAYDVDGQTFALSHRAGAADTAPPVHIVGVRQELGKLPPSGRPRMAPHSLLQEYLNRTEQVWGIVTNGVTLRVLRDSTFVRRQAYLEFDLAAIMEEQRFQDFAVLYRLLHRSRLPKTTADVETSLLERYYAMSQEQGGRVRDHLRDGVEQCITLLANGFLTHPSNASLRERAVPTCSSPDRIASDELYRQLLRIVYRLLFLLVSEDRGLLSGEAVYREHYGVGRLRRLLEHGRRAAFTDHDDLWQSLRVLWHTLRDERMAAMLGLPVLNGDLFDPQTLDGCALSNRHLLQAFWYLAWYQEKHGPPRRVNYAALDVEELGSVYESLLEFHPSVITDGAGRPDFQLIAGSERKTTGSYYTPPQLVNELVLSALDPVIQDRLAARPRAAEAALLSIRVCDPACGSGHFLLAAARRIGRALARVRSGDEEPAPEAVREATRDVIAHGIYGVDKNPLAVDLCRVALWLESHTGNKPLTFLNHRIRCGDSLVGVFDLATLTKGIPDKAFQLLEGDDKQVARESVTRNRSELAGFRELQATGPGASVGDFGARSRAVDAIRDDSAEAIRRKKQLFEESHIDAAWQRQKEACDLWTAAFFQPLKPGEPIITSGALVELLGGHRIDARITARAMVISDEQRFFHWPLEFPEVFADGGFDVVLSNPPWERVKLQEQEFFAARDARIATAPNKAARGVLIGQLPQVNPLLFSEFQLALRGASGASAFMRHGDRYPLAGRGDINTYAVFAELGANAIGPRGRTGLILPTGIATDDTTKFFFGDLVKNGRLADLVGFENEENIFPAVHHFTKFCKLTISGRNITAPQSRIAFYIRRFSQLQEPDRFFALEPADFALLNPNTGNCPIFRSDRDAELTKAIYRRVPVLWREATKTRAEENTWRLSLKTLFHMANDSDSFRTAAQLREDGLRLEGNTWVGASEVYLPLYEAKMLHQFDHRFSTYQGATEQQLNVGILPQPTSAQKRDPSFVVQPRYWVEKSIVDAAMPKFPEPLAEAVAADDVDSIRHVLGVWAAGYLLNRGRTDEAQAHLGRAAMMDLANKVKTSLDKFGNQLSAAGAALERDYPLREEDFARIVEAHAEPLAIGNHLLQRFVPTWLMGWRDITNSTNERTLIVSVAPPTAVGHKFQLIFSTAGSIDRRLLLGVLNSFVVDYCTRQKFGGTSFAYFVLKQIPVASPIGLNSVFILPRVLELVASTIDIFTVREDSRGSGSPILWDDDRRFQIRCELDAAFFHLYVPSQADGTWRPARIAEGNIVDETPEHLAALTRHFPTPRHAVAHILDSFPLVRKKDEGAHGRYRTKDRILEIYDGMLEAQRTGREWTSPLQPPPGTRLQVVD